MQVVKHEHWDLNNDTVLVVAARWAEPTAIKHRMYICQNMRSFRSARYIAFYNAGRIRHVYELVDVPYHNCTLDNTPILRTIDNLEMPEEPRQVMYIRPVADLDVNIANDTRDKNGRKQAFTYGHRYTTLARIIHARQTSDLVASPDEDVDVSPEEIAETEE